MTDEPKLMDNGVAVMPDGSGFFVAEVSSGPPTNDPIKWNPWNKVVQDHRDGTIHRDLTNEARQKRGLPVPWTSEMGSVEVHQKPVW